MGNGVIIIINEPWLEKRTAVNVVVNGHMSLYPYIFLSNLSSRHKFIKKIKKSIHPVSLFYSIYSDIYIYK